MASIKKKKSSGGGANWMDTYGDMVTLLLCFFVLLYSISTVDSQKWVWIIQSFNKDATVDSSSPVEGPDPEGSDEGGKGLPTTTEVEQAMDELYEFLVQYQQQNQSSSDISISKGDGYVFISFADAVFFSGNSFTLRPEGKAVLDDIIPALTAAGPYVDELQVLGHTAQLYSDRPNVSETDRLLAAQRSAMVASYLQENIPFEALDYGRLVSLGFGQWRNVSPNDSEAHRAKNRRVEMVVTGKNLDNTLSDNYQNYFTMYNSISTVSSD